MSLLENQPRSSSRASDRSGGALSRENSIGSSVGGSRTSSRKSSLVNLKGASAGDVVDSPGRRKPTAGATSDALNAFKAARKTTSKERSSEARKGNGASTLVPIPGGNTPNSTPTANRAVDLGNHQTPTGPPSSSDSFPHQDTTGVIIGYKSVSTSSSAVVEGDEISSVVGSLGKLNVSSRVGSGEGGSCIPSGEDDVGMSMDGSDGVGGAMSAVLVRVIKSSLLLATRMCLVKSCTHIFDAEVTPPEMMSHYHEYHGSEGSIEVAYVLRDDRKVQ